MNKYSIDMRTAAYVDAIEKVALATKLREYLSLIVLTESKLINSRAEELSSALLLR